MRTWIHPEKLASLNLIPFIRDVKHFEATSCRLSSKVFHGGREPPRGCAGKWKNDTFKNYTLLQNRFSRNTDGASNLASEWSIL